MKILYMPGLNNGLVSEARSRIERNYTVLDYNPQIIVSEARSRIERVISHVPVPVVINIVSEARSRIERSTFDIC